MLLRRVREHVGAHNWFAVGVDLVIVVLGVFLGIQVANWNDGLADRARARGYLERIHADLGADMAQFDSRFRFWPEVTAYGATGLSYAETGRLDDASNWEVLLAFFQASQVADFATVRATYDEMSSAGDLALIADTELRGALAIYYNNISPALSEYPAYREHVRGVIPIDVQSYIWANCYNNRDAAGIDQELLACASPIDEARAASIIQRIAGDETLMSELRYWISTMQIATLIARRRRADAVRFRERIEAALEQSR